MRSASRPTAFGGPVRGGPAPGLPAAGGAAGRRPARGLLALGLAAACLWPAGCAGPPDMRRGAGVGPHTPQAPPAGVLAVDGPAVLGRAAARARLRNPRPATPDVLAAGAELYGSYCLLCHGALGAGDGPLAAHFPRMPDLRGPRIARYADGDLYTIVRQGGFRMPAYADVLSAGERWAVVTYLRTLGGGDARR